MTTNGSFLDDYDYHLPDGMIAQNPVEPRDACRLMVLSDGIRHRTFSDLPEILQEGDLLVLNDSRVLRCRLAGTRSTGGAIELLVYGQGSIDGDRVWRALVKGKRMREGVKGTVSGRSGEEVDFTLVRQKGAGDWWLDLSSVRSVDDLDRLGTMPLPPYIDSFTGDDGEYQTVFEMVDAHTAVRPSSSTADGAPFGSVAAPTAGLHFTGRLLSELEEKGIGTAFINMEIGPGTFLPVRSENVSDHEMLGERFHLTPENAARIRGWKGRKIAVGTSVVRSLEHLYGAGTVEDGWHSTELFIHPGHKFASGIGGMLTNFHLPRSSVMMLTAAFAGLDRLKAAYLEAVRQGYRFYSFGDAMLVLP